MLDLAGSRERIHATWGSQFFSGRLEAALHVRQGCLTPHRWENKKARTHAPGLCVRKLIFPAASWLKLPLEL
jgi:hypothetical protein